MCGIFSYKGIKNSYENLSDSINLIKYRGPDNSQYLKVSKNVLFAFHRLSIVGIESSGNQPLKHPFDQSLTLICNGEIYNYKILAEKYDFNLQTGSDCEIILHMFKKFGIKKTVEELDGVFMFALHDAKSDTLYASRDPFGVRPGFIGYDNNAPDHTWYENDGVCNTVSMTHPLGSPVKTFDGIPKKGIWQMCEKLNMDHQAVIGHLVSKREFANIIVLYNEHSKLLYSLK